MIFVLDNYDSFTYNLVQLVGRAISSVIVRRNDQITPEEVRALRPRGIIISPGPGRPEHAGITLSLIRELGARIPILGVCLGHQAIGAAFGGRVIHAPSLMHGRTSEIHHCGQGMYHDMPLPFTATRYHSLVLEPSSLPADLDVTARTSGGTIMGVSHRSLPIDGVQFHPESILTDEGDRLLHNWLELRACI